MTPIYTLAIVSSASRRFQVAPRHWKVSEAAIQKATESCPRGAPRIWRGHWSLNGRGTQPRPRATGGHSNSDKGPSRLRAEQSIQPNQLHCVSGCNSMFIRCSGFYCNRICTARRWRELARWPVSWEVESSHTARCVWQVFEPQNEGRNVKHY